MIIVSQNKRKIINFNNISIIQIMDNNEIWVDTEKTCNNLGTYKTEERAKEVLKEIIKTFRGTTTTKQTIASITIESDYNCVYEMPED